jgi:hypothetical protein
VTIGRTTQNPERIFLRKHTLWKQFFIFKKMFTFNTYKQMILKNHVSKDYGLKDSNVKKLTAAVLRTTLTHLSNLGSAVPSLN